MTAAQKQKAVEAAIEEMLEAAQDGDAQEIEVINERAYAAAKGSNSRKDELKAGYAAALEALAARAAKQAAAEARLTAIREARQAALAAAQAEAEARRAAEAQPATEAAPPTEAAAAPALIDADRIAPFPSSFPRDHFVFVPQPRPVMSDAERDAYVEAHVIVPEGWEVVSTIATRRAAGARDFQIRIHFQPTPDEASRLEAAKEAAIQTVLSGATAPQVLARNETLTGALELGRASSNFYLRDIDAESKASKWRVLLPAHAGQILMGPETPIRDTLIASLHGRMIQRRGGGRPRQAVVSAQAEYQRERRARLKAEADKKN